MKFLFILIVAISSFSYAGDDKGKDGGKCTGSKYCGACKNCSHCKHCGSGGVCGVCSPESFIEKKSVKPKQSTKTKKAKNRK